MGKSSGIKSLSAGIVSVMLSNDLAGSEEEAECLAASILDEEGANSDEGRCGVVCVELFQEFFSLTEQESKDMLLELFPGLAAPALEDAPPEEGEDDSSEEWMQEEENEEEMIGEGECELCERHIRLTKHHLIPCSTWPRMLPRLVNAADALKSPNGSRRAQMILGDGLMHLEDALHDASKTNIRKILQRTCLICRPCHSTIHRTHDNLVLAREYNTIELLLRDESIYKFCKWASKQKAGKHALKH